MGKLFPHVYDLAMRPLEHKKLKDIRRELVKKTTGRVLEIGSGTGSNFPYYHHTVQVDAIEPNPIMRDRSLKRQAAASVRTHLLGAETLPFADNTFDSVVATLVFCTIPNPSKALQEIERVSKPGANLLLLEHVRVNHTLIGKTQDLLTPVWKKMCDGCHLNRDPFSYIENTSFSVLTSKTFYGGMFVTMQCDNNKRI